MNVKTIAINLNKTETEIKDACKDLFGRVPTQLNSEIEAKLKEHFQSDSTKQLPSSGVFESNTTDTQDSQPSEVKMSRAERKAKLEENRIKAMQAQGQSEAIRDFQIKRSSYEETFDFLEIEYHNRENIESAKTRHRSRYIGQNASEVNQIQKAEIMDVTDDVKQIEPQKIDLRMLLPGKTDTENQKPKFDLRDLL